MKKLQSQHTLLIGIATISLLAGLVGFYLAPTQIPIWYSLSIAEQHLDNKIMLFLFPTSIISIGVLHIALVRSFSQIDQVLGKIFVFATSIPAVILLMAQLHILLIVL